MECFIFTICQEKQSLIFKSDLFIYFFFQKGESDREKIKYNWINQEMGGYGRTKT